MKRLFFPLKSGFSFLVFLALLSMMDRSFGAESTGQKLFVANCVQCHGVNARGSMTEAKTLGVDPVKLDLTRESVVQKSSQYLKQRIADGHGKMPRHGQRLTLAEIRSLAVYIQSLQKAYVIKTNRVK